MELGPKKIIIFGDGSFYITETVLNMWIVMSVIILVSYLLTRKMNKIPKGPQIVAETIVSMIGGLVENTMGKVNRKAFTPYIGSLFIFLILANALGFLGIRPVTADVNTTFALAILTFVIIHGMSIKTRGLGGYIKHLASPYAFMLPINMVTEIALPVSLAFRLFGNITGGMIIMTLAMQGLKSITDGLGIGIPFLQIAIPLPLNFFFDVFEPILQAFIFTMLTMVFIVNAMAIKSEEP